MQCPSCGYSAYKLDKYTILVGKAMDEKETRLVDEKTVKIKEIVSGEKFSPSAMIQWILITIIF